MPGGEALAASLLHQAFDLAALVLPLCGSALTLVGIVFAHRQHGEETLKVDYLVASEERDHAIERAERAERALHRSERARLRLEQDR